MSQCTFEGKRMIIDESGLDERSRSLIEFAADLATSLPMSRPARPNEQGIIDREVAADVSESLRAEIAKIALRSA